MTKVTNLEFIIYDECDWEYQRWIKLPSFWEGKRRNWKIKDHVELDNQSLDANHKPMHEISRTQSICLVGTATSYGLNGPEIESWLWRGFPHPPDGLWGRQSLLCKGYRVFHGGKAAWAWRWLPTPSKAEVKERIVLYFCSLSEPSWHVLGWNLPLPLPISMSRDVTEGIVCTETPRFIQHSNL